MTDLKKLPNGRYRYRWYEAGRGSPRRTRTFDRKQDAERFANHVQRQKQMRGVAFLDIEAQTVKGLSVDWWERHVEPNLERVTKEHYARMLDKHIVPHFGAYKLYEVSPESVADFRAKLERKGVGRWAVRQSLVVLGAMFNSAQSWGRVASNPVAAVKKPSMKRQKAVRALPPVQVEAVRGVLLARDRTGDACLVSVLAYAGLRPEEALALEWSHVRDQTLLVEQKNVDGELVDGQKVKTFPARTVDLVSFLRQDLTDWKLRSGRRTGLVFPNKQGGPWHKYDWDNWRSRVWAKAMKQAGVEYTRPYDLRHSFASLQVRAGTSVPELAEQMGHSPAMTLAAYTHVIRELRGLPSMSVTDQIQAARSPGERVAVG